MVAGIILNTRLDGQRRTPAKVADRRHQGSWSRSELHALQGNQPECSHLRCNAQIQREGPMVNERLRRRNAISSNNSGNTQHSHAAGVVASS
jgi:hypothetical protein